MSRGWGLLEKDVCKAFLKVAKTFLFQLYCKVTQDGCYSSFALKQCCRIQQDTQTRARRPCFDKANSRREKEAEKSGAEAHFTATSPNDTADISCLFVTFFRGNKMFQCQPIKVFLLKLCAATHTHAHTYSLSKLSLKLQKVMVDPSRPPLQSQVSSMKFENCVTQG